VYLSYVEDCGMQMASAYGWPTARMAREGIAVVARQHRIEYRWPAVMDDDLEITTWITDVKRSTAVRHSAIARLNDRTLLVRACTVHVWVDPRTGKPIPIPDAFLADFAPSLSGGPL
jgi:acyl-CoA thioester hydrolase